jgi:hypothetical protein
MQLFGCKRPTLSNDRRAVAAVDVGTLDRTVVQVWHPHIRPVDLSSIDIDDDAVGVSATGDNDL